LRSDRNHRTPDCPKEMEPAEYERRRIFCELMTTMGKSEHVEIGRILRKHGVAMSENRSGLYFDMAKLNQVVFDDLLKFRDFVIQNNKELNKRDHTLQEMLGCKGDDE
jgi:hypothetical protein